MKLFTQTIGHGPDVVLLHGWGLHSAIWTATTDSLAVQLSQHYRVTMIDLPGHGLSEGNYVSFDLPEIVRAIAALLPAKTILIGWSLGGLLALQLAHNYPGQITRLVLLASTARFTHADGWASGLPKSTLDNFANALIDKPELTVQRFLALQVRGSENERQQLRQLKQALRERPNARPQALCSALSILQNSDLRPELTTILQPCRIILGENDRIVRSAAGVAMTACLPRATSTVIANASHAPFLSHPEQTLNSILEFINE